MQSETGAFQNLYSSNKEFLVHEMNKKIYMYIYTHHIYWMFLFKAVWTERDSMMHQSWMYCMSDVCHTFTPLMLAAFK